MFLPIYVEENQGSSSKDDELLCQEQTEVADESQTQGAEEDEPMTVHFAFNCKFQHFASNYEYSKNPHTRTPIFGVQADWGLIYWVFYFFLTYFIFLLLKKCKGYTLLLIYCIFFM